MLHCSIFIRRIRLGEGFNFAYSTAGITDMVLEVQMQGFGNHENFYPCIIQYVLFPPHVVPNAALERDSGTEDDTEEGIRVFDSPVERKDVSNDESSSSAI